MHLLNFSKARYLAITATVLAVSVFFFFSTENHSEHPSGADINQNIKHTVTKEIETHNKLPQNTKPQIILTETPSAENIPSPPTRSHIEETSISSEESEKMEVEELHPTSTPLPTTPKDQFTKEPHDSLWAADQEFFYIDLFSSEEDLSGFVLSEVKCKTTACKLSFLVTDEEQSDEITNSLIKKMLDRSPSLEIDIAPPQKSNRMALYVKESLSL